jgi:hypothetical protein
MKYSASTHVLTGRTVPLTPPPSTLAVWQTSLSPDVLDPAHPDSPLQCYHQARGYRFAWGQVLERRVPPDGPPPTGLLQWDFILTDAQQQYHAGGGNLDELADMAYVFLDTYLPRHAPRWVRYDDGAPPAAFAFLVAAPHRPAARRWLQTFLTQGMPLLLRYVLDVNAAAWQDDPPAADG